MITKLKLLALIVVLWFLFGAATLLAIPALPIGLLLFQAKYVGSVFKAQDRLLAALFGFSGDKTVSRECGEQPDTTTLCKRIMQFVRAFHPEHFDRYTKQ